MGRDQCHWQSDTVCHCDQCSSAMPVPRWTMMSESGLRRPHPRATGSLIEHWQVGTESPSSQVHLQVCQSRHESTRDRDSESGGPDFNADCNHASPGPGLGPGSRPGYYL